MLYTITMKCVATNRENKALFLPSWNPLSKLHVYLHMMMALLGFQNKIYIDPNSFFTCCLLPPIFSSTTKKSYWKPSNATTLFSFLLIMSYFIHLLQIFLFAVIVCLFLHNNCFVFLFPFFCLLIFCVCIFICCGNCGVWFVHSEVSVFKLI